MQDVKSDSVAYYKNGYQENIVKKNLETFCEKSGFCTAYAHACGYMDTLRFGDFYLTMELDGVYQVRVYHTNEPQVKWLSFDSRPDAKKAFLTLRRLIKRGASIQDIEQLHI